MVLMHPQSLQTMGTCFPLKLEGYGDERREHGEVRVSLKKRELPLKLEKSKE